MRTLEMTAKTVEEALEAACAQLGVDRDDLNVSYEVLDMPVKKLFKSIPARVKVTVEEPEQDNKPEPVAPAPQAPAEPEGVIGEVKKAVAFEKAEKPAPKAAKPEKQQGEGVPLVIAEDAQMKAAVEYLTPIFTLMGAENLQFSAMKKDGATILKVDGDHVGALIGRRGETMESLSYLASLVVNRMEGDYIKLGLDVAGYRDKREEDLATLTKRLCDRVIKSGHCYEMEAMNPYERHIIHAAVGEIEGVRSESAGEGKDRHVVIYSTDPNASNTPERRENSRGGYGNRSSNRGYGNRSGAPRHDGNRSGYGNRDGGSRNPRPYGNRDGNRDGNRSGYGARPYSERGPRPSSVPAREFAETPHDATTAPSVPTRTERINDGDFDLFGKIEL